MRRSSVRHPLLTAVTLWVLLTGAGMALLGSYASARASSRPGAASIR
jgi:protein-S-isoprenylcysteine O-methyltransferase Ste14